MFKRNGSTGNHKIAVALIVLIFTVTFVHADTTVSSLRRGHRHKLSRCTGREVGHPGAMYSSRQGQANALIGPISAVCRCRSSWIPTRTSEVQHE
jgi:hypothetical protein